MPPGVRISPLAAGEYLARGARVRVRVWRAMEGRFRFCFGAETPKPLKTKDLRRLLP